MQNGIKSDIPARDSSVNGKLHCSSSVVSPRLEIAKMPRGNDVTFDVSLIMVSVRSKQGRRRSFFSSLQIEPIPSLELRVSEILKVESSSSSSCGTAIN